MNDSPPMPAAQALNQVVIEESWERFEKQTSLDASLAVSNALFSIDINASQTGQLRREEEAYYALRNSFIPLWTLYISNTGTFSDTTFDIDVPVPFCHEYRHASYRLIEPGPFTSQSTMKSIRGRRDIVSLHSPLDRAWPTVAFGSGIRCKMATPKRGGQVHEGDDLP